MPGKVSILGMLEGVLKARISPVPLPALHSFNPWYVGGGVKSTTNSIIAEDDFRFNPWYVGGGVKRVKLQDHQDGKFCFNPWYVGGGVKSIRISTTFADTTRFNPWYVGGGVKSNTVTSIPRHIALFQSLVCWRGC